jgi:nucleoside-diphosphate-sugar epimerase
MRVFVAGATGAIGQHLVPMHAPAWLGKLLGGELVVLLMTEARGSSNAKAKRELGWTPRYPSWRDGFPVWTKEAHDRAA